MKKVALREVASTVAVVASLVFVGLEIRQNTAAQRSQTRQAISDAATDYFMRMAEDPELLMAFQAVFLSEPPRAVSSADSARVDFVMLGVLRRMENIYLQHQEGVFGPEILQTYGFSGGAFARQGFRDFWTRELLRDVFDPSFVEAFEQANNLR